MAENVKKGTSKAKATTKKPASAKPRKQAAATNGAAPSNGAAAKTNGSHARRNTSAAKATGTKVTHEQVAELAHRFWNERGRQHGHHEEDWYRAEQELHASAP